MSQVSDTLYEVPEYEVIRRSFFAPDTLEPGTRLLYEGVPGDHLRPLNAAAQERMEIFYSMKFPERDSRTKELTGKMLAPREVFRPVPVTENIHHGHKVTAVPDEPALSLDVKSLAELAATRKATNPRPPGDPVPKSIPVKAVG